MPVHGEVLEPGGDNAHLAEQGAKKSLETTDGYDRHIKLQGSCVESQKVT